MFTSITYDSAETGSTELRCDNIVNVFEHLQGKQRTPIGDYAFEYDSIGKMKEPLFDGFMCGIALLPDTTFDASFSYIPVKNEDGPQLSCRETGLSTSYLEGKLSRADLQYQSARHIFIMGPLNKTFMDYLETIHEPTIFHIQGDAPDKTKERSTTSYSSPLTHNGGIFPCSFNQWTGESCWRLFRSKMSHTYTVKCTSTDLVEIPAKCNKTLQPITIQLPSIYVQLREYMVNSILLGLDHSFSFSNLNVIAIFQDMIDKDNLVSCAMLLQHTTTIPYLSLIGRRVYDFQPVPMSSYNFREFMESNGELQYPAGNPNGDFNLQKTMENHTHAVLEFRKRLPFEFSFDPISTSDIADGVSAMSESKRSPFAEGIVAKVGFMKL